MKIYLIRHANYIPLRDNDGNLTEKGKQQANRLGQRFSQEKLFFQKIYSSLKIRAYETAEIVARKIGIEEIIKSNEIIEDESDESKQEVASRMKGFIDRIKIKLKNENIAIFSHYYSIKYLLSSISQNSGIGLPHAGVVLLDYSSDRLKLTEYDSSKHLTGIETY